MSSPVSQGRVALPPVKGMADTPDLLADALVRAVNPAGTGSWLDPSAGSGQLVAAALRAGVSPEAILAIDLQSDLPPLSTLGVESLTGTDFLCWAQATDRRFDRVIANPPFVQLRELEEALLHPALEMQIDGFRVPATANYWVAFLVAGMRLLKPGGSLAYILPAAWEYANYAIPLRNICESLFGELDVHRVSVPMFETVADGSVLLVGRGFGQRPRRRTHIFRHSTLSELNRVVCDSDSPKTSSAMCSREFDLPADHVEFGDIANIRVGAVTGDASYFLLNEAQRLTSSTAPLRRKACAIEGTAHHRVGNRPRCLGNTAGCRQARVAVSPLRRRSVASSGARLPRSSRTGGRVQPGSNENPRPRALVSGATARPLRRIHDGDVPHQAMGGAQSHIGTHGHQHPLRRVVPGDHERQRAGRLVSVDALVDNGKIEGSACPAIPSGTTEARAGRHGASCGSTSEDSGRRWRPLPSSR